MKNHFLSKTLFLFVLTQSLFGQVFSYKSDQNGQEVEHRIFMDGQYFVATEFTSNPNQFIKTFGGFYTDNGSEVFVDFEFNSNFSKDSLKSISISNRGDWQKISKSSKPLQGKWLMAGRVNGDTERRRATNRPRKTMKILVDGYFQWIAFNAATLSFMGTGGGRYTAENGTYTEFIDYFSKDNNKVGISLTFEYLQKNQDWHHKGFSSKGDPLHEIWTFRKQ
tara:strand:- start:1848 stop:2513 length:666 start_codon:yes stop_codon:yes gene_type:complete